MTTFNHSEAVEHYTILMNMIDTLEIQRTDSTDAVIALCLLNLGILQANAWGNGLEFVWNHERKTYTLERKNG